MVQLPKTNHETAAEIKTFGKVIEKFYYTDRARENHFINEILYGCAGIILECAQGVDGGNFSIEYLREKTTTIIRSAMNATDGSVD